jgi:hypothetical protein
MKWRFGTAGPCSKAAGFWSLAVEAGLMCVVSNAPAAADDADAAGGCDEKPSFMLADCCAGRQGAAAAMLTDQLNMACR